MNHRPRRRFGQNFLTDRSAIERIIAAVAPGADEHIVEVGPGQAALTAALLPGCARLTAIEIDRDLAAALAQRFADAPNFRLITEDVLKVDLAELGPGPLRVVGNLPYNISTPLIFHLLKSPATITDLHVMLQREVAERIVAAPGSKTYGRLSVAVQLAAEAEILFRLPPGAFNPPPKVHSAVVRLRPRPAALPWRALDGLLIAAFGARRKTLRNALANWFDATELEAQGIDPGQRPDALDPAQYLALARRLAAA